jgi:cytochrome c2
MPRRVGVLSWVCAAGLITAMAVPLAAQFGRTARPQVVPPQGPPRQVIFKYCTSCHGIDDYAYSALDRAAWDAHLTGKHEGMEVPLPDQERGVLLDWLAERFGPDTKPFPREYVAPEVTIFLSDTGARALLERACSSCHELDRIDAARFTPDRWRVVALDMRERGAELADVELERLVEWLGRTRGTNDSDRQ